jgi:peptide-methionine (S)-S-oxide reductase
VQSGDADTLARALDAEPELLHERITDPAIYGESEAPAYFRDPKLLWFVANNPILVDHMAPGMVDVARVMLERGPEQADCDYALGLTMSGRSPREHGLQRPLMDVLLDAGAVATREAIAAAGAHREVDALRALLDRGLPRTAAIAAALGDEDELRQLLAGAPHDDVQMAFALAVINGHLGAARVAIDRDADVSALLPVHGHSTALHQAAANDDAAMVELLLNAGARTDVRDTLWNGTPLGWAIHEEKRAARRVLELST